MKRNIVIGGIVMIASLLLVGCGGSSDNGTSNDNTQDTVKVSLNGKIQKGPYKAGTTVIIQELDDNLKQTGKSYTATIKNDEGDYEFSGELTSSIVEMYANGFYFDEISGKLSSAKLGVSIIIDLAGKNKVNINILSSLITPRIKQLVQEGKSFSEAKQEAESDLLKSFKIDDKNLNFESFDLSDTDEKAKVLLSITSQLLQAATTKDSGVGSVTGQLQGIIANFGDDLKDGMVDGATLKDTLEQAAKDINVSQVQANLRENFSYDVPSFDEYIDEDGDGTVALDDIETVDSFTFETLSNVEPNVENISNTITISGLADTAISKLSIDNSDASIILNGQKVSENFVFVKNDDQVAIALQSSYSKSSTFTNVKVGEYNTTFTVNLKEIAPIITLQGDINKTVLFNSVYEDEGAVANDNIDGEITENIVVHNPVDTSKVGTYIVTYNVLDSALNEAIEVTRSVTVIDVTAPVMTLNGNRTTKIQGTESYIEEGAVAYDDVDGDISNEITIDGSVDVFTPGQYIITYTATDKAGNESKLERIVTVERFYKDEDTNISSDTLTGLMWQEENSTMTTPEEGSFDPITGMPVYDNNHYFNEAKEYCETSEVGGFDNWRLPQASEVNELAYNYIDGESIDTYSYVKYDGYLDLYIQPIIRCVRTNTDIAPEQVGKDVSAPIITLHGDRVITILIGETLDLNATAEDYVDGNVTGKITIYDTVDVHTPGHYSIRYSVTDEAGNQSNIERTVKVERFYSEESTKITSDLLTGLMWQEENSTMTTPEEGSFNPITGMPEYDNNHYFNQAKEYCETSEVGGFDNWRLPQESEVNELAYNYIDSEYIDTYGYVTTSRYFDPYMQTVVRCVRTNTDIAPEQVGKDVSAPIITFNGSIDMTILIGDSIDLNATAVDYVDDVVDVNRTIEELSMYDFIEIDEIDVNRDAKYRVTYESEDKNGNTAYVTQNITVTRYIKNPDNNLSTDILTGIMWQNENILSSYIYDNQDSEEQIRQAENTCVNSNVAGFDDWILAAYVSPVPYDDMMMEEYRHYRCARSDTNIAPEEVTNDELPPLLTLNGEKNVTVLAGENYIEQNVVAVDYVDGTINDINITIIKNDGDIYAPILTEVEMIDTTSDGNYVVWYGAQDSSGNISHVKRNVSVVRYTRDDVTKTVTDHVTGLMWQDDEAVNTVLKPLITEENYNLGNYSDMSGDTAYTYCDGLVLGGYDDWRLPTTNELISLLHDDLWSYPSLNKDIFKNVSQYFNVAIDSDKGFSGLGEYISLNGGGEMPDHTYRMLSARCVR